MGKQRLTQPILLIKKAFKIYFEKSNLAYFIKIMAIYYLYSLVWSYYTSLELDWVFLPGFIIGFVVLLWLQTTLYEAVRRVNLKESLNVRLTFKMSWPKVWRFFTVGLLMGIAVVIGMLFLIIPGLILAVWLSFSQFIVITEGLKVKDSLLRSRDLVGGYFWPVLGRYLVFFLFFLSAQLALLLIPYLGPMVAVLAMPVFLTPSFLMYRQLKKIKALGE